MAMPKIIVSLASYPKRIGYAARAIEPLLRQTLPADRVYLWLPMEEFAQAGVAIPDEIWDLQDDPRFSVEDCPVNLRPHNKYVHVMQKHRDDIVITVDDDVVYPPDFIARLVKMHYRHPRSVVGERTHRVLKDPQGNLVPYAQWGFCQEESSNVEELDLMATGVGGILYPPRAFDEPVFDHDAIRDSALLVDDLWLFIHEQRLGLPVVNTDEPCVLHYIEGSQECGLYHRNLEGGGNDVMLAALFDLFPDVRAAVLERARPLPEPPAGQPDPAADRPEAPARRSMLGRMAGALRR